MLGCAQNNGGRVMKLWLGLLLAFGLAGGARAAGPADGPVDVPVDVQVIVSLTGNGAVLGLGEKLALQQAEQLVNQTGGIAGRPLRYVLHDGQSNPQIAVQLATELIGGGARLILGPSLVPECSATAPLMKNGPVMWCFAPGIHPAPGSFVFSGDASTSDLTDTLVRFLRLKGWTRVGVITSTDASGQDAERGLREAFALPENAAIRAVDWERFAPGDVTVSAQIEQLRAASPQVLVAWSTGAPVGTLFRGIRQAGITLPVASGDGNMTYAAMTQFADILPKELYFPAVPWMAGDDPGLHLDPRVVAAQLAYQKAFAGTGRRPDAGTLVGWEPAMILAEALRRAGPDASAAQLRDTLARMRDFASIAGIYDFPRTPQRGLDSNDTIVTRWNAQAQNWEAVSQLRGIPIAGR